MANPTIRLLYLVCAAAFLAAASALFRIGHWALRRWEDERTKVRRPNGDEV